MKAQEKMFLPFIMNIWILRYKKASLIYALPKFVCFLSYILSIKWNFTAGVYSVYLLIIVLKFEVIYIYFVPSLTYQSIYRGDDQNEYNRRVKIPVEDNSNEQGTRIYLTLFERAIYCLYCTFSQQKCTRIKYYLKIVLFMYLMF